MKREIVGCLFILLLVGIACTDENDVPCSTFSQRTVLIYMAADNNLYKSAWSDIEEILTADIPEDNHLIVYLDIPEWIDKAYPQLIEIKRGEKTIIKQYEPQNSASGTILNSVIKDVITTFPSYSYGLILWSHGTGWLPKTVFDDFKNQKQLRAFGKDGDNEMNLIELASAIPIHFEYIIFDACLMGSIEVFYQLRNKTNIIVASPTETLIAGFPYDKILPFLFTSLPSYAELAQSYMNYHKSNAGELQSASITIVDTKQLENLAVIFKEIAKDDIVYPDKESVQKYYIQPQIVFYDLQDYLSQAITDQNLITVLKQQIARIVKYHDHTPYFLGTLILEKSCGISVYIPFDTDSYLDEQYKQLDWYIDSKLYPLTHAFDPLRQ
ncbi:MAG: hypothetical protein LBU03_02725 [Tannerellaceae bacterium]|jgi:hypothetical protein|nr:hypothetical protein [Tannerellaceae bacterium]